MRKAFCFLLLFAMSCLCVFPTFAAGAAPVESITLDMESAVIAVGKTITLKAVVTPKNASVKKLQWSSSDESVATVKNGKVKAVACGTATISVKAEDGGEAGAGAVITVVIPVKKVTLSEKKLTIAPGTKWQLTAEALPEDASNKELTWTSSNEKVAAVDEKGIITGKEKGTASITAVSADGSGAKATVAVSVQDFDLVFTTGAPQTADYYYGSGQVSVRGSVKTGNVRIPEIDADMNVMMAGSQAKDTVAVTPVSPGTDAVTIKVGKKNYTYTAYVSPEAVEGNASNGNEGPEEGSGDPGNGNAGPRNRPLLNVIIAPEEEQDGSVLFLDDEYITAELLSFEDYPWDGAFYADMRVTNKTKSDARVTLVDVRVNDTPVQTEISGEQDSIPPRKDGTVSFAFPYEQAGIGSFEEVRHILFKIRVLDEKISKDIEITEEYILKRAAD